MESVLGGGGGGGGSGGLRSSEFTSGIKKKGLCFEDIAFLALVITWSQECTTSFPGFSSARLSLRRDGQERTLGTRLLHVEL